MFCHYITTAFTTRLKNCPESDTSSVMQLWANVCTWPRHATRERQASKASEGTQKEAEEWDSSHSQAKMVQFAGPDTQGRNAFKQSKGRNRKKGKEEREGGMRAEGICASLWETFLVLIYTSMTTAQNDFTVREQQQPKERKKKTIKKPIKWRKKRADGSYSLAFFTFVLLNMSWSGRSQTEI